MENENKIELENSTEQVQQDRDLDFSVLDTSFTYGEYRYLPE